MQVQAAVLLTLSVVANTAGCAMAPEIPRFPPKSTSPTLASWPSHGAIQLGQEKPGLQLDAAVAPGVGAAVPRWDVLRASYRGSWWLVDNLNELRGLLRINDAGTALRYVRFWSDVGGGGLWDNLGGFEIVDAKTFRLTPCWYGRPSLFYDESYPRSGLKGILSVKAFRAGGFCLPRVQQTTNGFVIERWIFFWGDNPIVQRIREFVGQDGSYRRVVLEQMRAPKLPGTRWMVPAYR